MGTARITRAGYRSEYTYFIDMTGKDWRVQSNGIHRTFDENGDELSSEPYSVKIESQADSAETLQAYLDNHAVLVVAADKETLQADDVDSVTWSIAGQTTFDYRLFKNNIEIAVGTADDGSLVFRTDEKDIYLVELKVGTQTGYAMVVAE